MTTNKHLKRRVRSRAARTGEPYATALRRIRLEQETRMSSTTTDVHDVLTHCSFCGKPHTAVDKLIAGPGVYICNKCVALSATIIDNPAARTASTRSSRRDYPTEDILAMLPVLVRSAERVEAELAGWIGRLRERQIEWQAIAAATGMSVDTARQRFDTVLPE
jgi:hypothetical protein